MPIFEYLSSGRSQRLFVSSTECCVGNGAIVLKIAGQQYEAPIIEKRLKNIGWR
jgi:hypothetical protein